MNKKRLYEIIKDLIEVVEETNLNISDKIIFEQSCMYERGEIANENKSSFKSSQVGKSDSKEVGRESDKPTEKQINFLKKSGVLINPNLTKREAKIMIQTYINNLKKENI